ncbi:zinc finger protein 501-like [Colias croceus]|uniref:zinc finger protein 501-like n=1 Tax=Colias crocea TaxID=72248 RepID=UPI001E27F311|nr:zinc finger protein 501-like [Colias croceus]
METSNLCRGCMKEVEVSEDVNTDKNTLDMFCYCTNITITEDDILPKQFCHDCELSIQSSYSFIKRAQHVNITLRNISLRQSASVIVIPNKTKDIQNEILLHENRVQDSLSIIESCNEIDTNEYKIEGVEKEISTNELEFIESDIKSETKNTCPECKKTFISIAWFNKHMENECSGRNFECKICNKKFPKKSKLVEHTTIHSEQRQYVCNTCGRQFQRRKQLTSHLISHSSERPYTCEKCSKSFKLKRILIGHMKIHDDVKQYLCSFCGWSTSQANNLQVHQRSHTGAKPFACECGFRTATRSSLRRHRLRHSQRRAHACSHCGKAFYDVSALARHRRTHTGELPYACTRCARAFADSWKRKNHLMRAHGLGLSDIPRMRKDGQQY